MSVRIKQFIYSLYLFAGRIFFSDHHSKVLYYHDLHFSEEEKCTDMSTTLALFKKHLKIIAAQNFEIVTQITKPLGQIQITFDDGFRGLYNNKEFFKSKGIFPTVFIVTDWVGKPEFLTWPELRELQTMGFPLQSHTHTHKDLNTLTADELFYELNSSKQILQEKLNTVIDEVCFPKGLFNEAVLEVCRSVGYKKWYCSIPGSYNEVKIYPELKFRNLVQFSSPGDFKNIIDGGMNIFKSRYSKSHYGKNIFK